jgi:uncharacterized protein (TIGR03086 family)
MSEVEMMRKVITETKGVVAGIEPDQLGDPTPCTEWDVRALLNHITGGSLMFAECVESGSIPDEEMGRLTSTDLVGDDYVRVFGAAADRATAAFDAPGALAKIVTLPFGEMPAGVALQIAIFDVTTHALDLAQATGQSTTAMTPDVLQAAWDAGQAMIGPELRDAGLFGPQQDAPADAPLADRILAFAGRKV